MNTAEVIAKKDEEIKRLEREVYYLKFEIENFKRIIFGSKREKFVPAHQQGQPRQTSLFEELEKEATKEKDAEVVQEEITYKRRKTKKHKGRNPLPDNIPVEEQIIEPEEIPQGAKHIGDEVSESIDYTPASLVKKRIIRRKYAKPNDQGIVIAELPEKALPKCIAEPGLLAHILVAKWVDHMPFYRKCQQLKRDYNWDLSTNTVYGWQSQIGKVIVPLFELHKRQVLSSSYIQADESPIKVQDDNVKEKTHQGYQWVYRNPEKRLVLFDYRKTRGRQGPKKLLEKYEGIIQCDGWQVYETLAKEIPQWHLAGCLAHLRRKYYDSKKYDKAKANYALNIIQKVYKEEKAAKTSENRFLYRIKHIVPLMKEFKAWVDKEIKMELPRSPLGKAFTYTVKQWDKIMHIFTDERIELDNNLIENKIRPLALGRKNYLFAGSHKGAVNMAMMYSFMATCKEHNVNPYEWLKYVLENIHTTKMPELYRLLPQNYRAI